MSKLDNVVKVTITRETQPVGKASFNVIMVVGANYTFSGRYKLYSTDDLAALAADLTGGTGAIEYKAAQRIASQSPRPNSFAGGSVKVGDTTWTDALNAIKLENGNFYGVIAATKTVATQKLVCNWINANKRCGMFSTAGTDVGAGVIDIIDQNLSTDTTSLVKYVKTNALDRCVVIYHKDAATDYVEAGLLAALLVQRPGTYTPMFTTVVGSAVDDLTPTQQANLFSKYGSSYEEVGEVNIIQEGWVGTGEYVDFMPIWLDWLESQLQSSIYSLLVNSPKVPYTDAGIGLIEAEVKKVLKLEQSANAISEDAFDDNKIRIGGFVTSVPALANISSVDKLARTLKEVKFTAFYENPIHRVEVNGIIKI